MSAKIAVLGASGQIGRFLLPQLHAVGKSVIALSRNPPAAIADASPQWREADLYGLMPDLGEVNTLISLGPLDAMVKWLTSSYPMGLRRIVAFSSMSAESKRDSADAAERALAALLHDSEQQLLSLGRSHRCAVTIFRPTLIYGAGLDRSLTPLARFAQRWRVLPIPLGANGLRQPVHAQDLAHACVAVLGRISSFDRIYPLGGGERLSFRAVCWRVRASTPRATLPLPVPISLLHVALLLRGSASFGALSATTIQRLQTNLVADNRAATEDFGYTPRDFHPEPASWNLPP